MWKVQEGDKMIEEQQKVREFIEGISSQTMNTKPTIPSLEVRILRARLMLEECLETIDKGLGIDVFTFNDTKIEFEDLEFESSISGKQSDLVEIADGLADQIVVILGTAISCGINLGPIFDEVMHNNMLKLKTGTIDEHGKLIKSPDHPKPRIEFLIRRQLGLE